MDTEKIWSDFSTLLKKFILTKVKNETTADDILQEVFIKIHEKIPSLEDHNKLTSWVYQITRNTIIDFYRKKARSKSLQAEDLWYGNEKMSLQQEVAQCILPFIQALPKDNADLLTAIIKKRRLIRRLFFHLKFVGP